MNESVLSCLTCGDKGHQKLGGCVGILFQLMDWNRRLTGKRFFSHNYKLPILPDRKRVTGCRNSGKLPMARLLLIADEKRASSLTSDDDLDSISEIHPHYNKGLEQEIDELEMDKEDEEEEKEKEEKKPLKAQTDISSYSSTSGIKNTTNSSGGINISINRSGSCNTSCGNSSINFSSSGVSSSSSGSGSGINFSINSSGRSGSSNSSCGTSSVNSSSSSSGIDISSSRNGRRGSSGINIVGSSGVNFSSSNSSGTDFRINSSRISGTSGVNSISSSSGMNISSNISNSNTSGNSGINISSSGINISIISRKSGGSGNTNCGSSTINISSSSRSGVNISINSSRSGSSNTSCGSSTSANSSSNTSGGGINISSSISGGCIPISSSVSVDGIHISSSDSGGLTSSNGKRRTPGVVARLMGLDSLPSPQLQRKKEENEEETEVHLLPWKSSSAKAQTSKKKTRCIGELSTANSLPTPPVSSINDPDLFRSSKHRKTLITLPSSKDYNSDILPSLNYSCNSARQEGELVQFPDAVMPHAAIISTTTICKSSEGRDSSNNPSSSCNRKPSGNLSTSEQRDQSLNFDSSLQPTSHGEENVCLSQISRGVIEFEQETQEEPNSSLKDKTRRPSVYIKIEANPDSERKEGKKAYPPELQTSLNKQQNTSDTNKTHAMRYNRKEKLLPTNVASTKPDSGRQLSSFSPHRKKPISSNISTKKTPDLFENKSGIITSDRRFLNYAQNDGKEKMRLATDERKKSDMNPKKEDSFMKLLLKRRAFRRRIENGESSFSKGADLCSDLTKVRDSKEPSAVSSKHTFDGKNVDLAREHEKDEDPEGELLGSGFSNDHTCKGLVRSNNKKNSCTSPAPSVIVSARNKMKFSQVKRLASTAKEMELVDLQISANFLMEEFGQPSPVSILESPFQDESSQSSESLDNFPDSKYPAEENDKSYNKNAAASTSGRFIESILDIPVYPSCSTPSSLGKLVPLTTKSTIRDGQECKEKVIKCMDLTQKGTLISPFVLRGLDRESKEWDESIGSSYVSYGLNDEPYKLLLESPCSTKKKELSMQYGKLIMDCVNEALSLKMRSQSIVPLVMSSTTGFHPWSRDSLMPNSRYLERAIQDQLQYWKRAGGMAVDELVDRDLNAPHGSWTDCNNEVVAIGLDVEKAIFQTLIDDLVGAVFAY